MAVMDFELSTIKTYRGHCYFLKVTGDIGGPPSRAPGVSEVVLGVV